MAYTKTIRACVLYVFITCRRAELCFFLRVLISFWYHLRAVYIFKLIFR